MARPPFVVSLCGEAKSPGCTADPPSLWLVIRPETVAGVIRNRGLGTLFSGSQSNILASCQALGRCSPLALIHILLRSGGPEGGAALGWEDILLSRPGFTVARLNSPRSHSTVCLVLALIRNLFKTGLGDLTQSRSGTSQSPLLEKKQPCLALLPEDSWKEDELNTLSLGWSPTSERVRLPREGP